MISIPLLWGLVLREHMLISVEQHATQPKETFLIQTVTDSFSVTQVTANFPRELRERPQWMYWRGEDRIDQGTGEVKVSKPPIDPKTLKKADKTDPRTWGTFEDCCTGIECALGACPRNHPSGLSTHSCPVYDVRR